MGRRSRTTAGAPAAIEILETRRLLTATVDWQQVGADIDGTEAGHLFGETVALSNDGRTLAVRQFEVNGDALVEVQVYQLSETAGWVKSGGLINAGISDDNGWVSLAISGDGDTLVVSADRAVHGGIETGEVRVFERATGADDWSPVGSVLTGSQAGQHFGSSVAMSDDGRIIAVGSIHLGLIPSVRGTAQMFRRSDCDQWVPYGNEIFGKSARDLFGGSVALTADGQTLAVGARDSDEVRNHIGNASVYQFDSLSQQWTPVGSTIAGQYREQSARAVAISDNGQTLAVTTNQGARVYRLIDNEWQLFGQEIADERSSRAGTVVLSADGQRIALGMPFYSTDDASGGLVRWFEFDSTAAEWKQLGPDIFGEAANDRSGTALAISADGETLAIGAYDNDDGGDRAGHVRVFAVDRTPSAFDTPPEITAPTGTVSDASVVAAWAPVYGAESYQLWLWLSDRSQNIRVLYRSQITDTEFDLSEQPDGRYRLWIRAVDCDGRMTPWSGNVDFTINRSGQSNSLLASTNFDQSTQALQWQTTQTVDSHWLWINQPDGTIVINQRGLLNATADLSALQGGTYIAWLSFDVQGAQSEWERFEVEVVSQVPQRPVIVSPSVNETSGDVAFQWMADDAAQHYELQLNYEGFGRVIHLTNVTASSYRPPVPLWPGQWTFWVRAVNANGESRLWCSRFDMTVANPNSKPFDPALALPVTVFGADGIISWAAIERATRYEIWISDTVSNRTVVNESVVGLQYTPDLNPGSYRVWIRAIDGLGITSRWSLATTFRIGARLPGGQA